MTDFPLAKYFVISVVILLTALALYKYFSVSVIHSRSGASRIRIGWHEYKISNEKVYRVEDDFATHYYLVDTLNFENYVNYVVYKAEKYRDPERTICKRFLRTNFGS